MDLNWGVSGLPQFIGRLWHLNYHLLGARVPVNAKKIFPISLTPNHHYSEPLIQGGGWIHTFVRFTPNYGLTLSNIAVEIKTDQTKQVFFFNLLLLILLLFLKNLNLCFIFLSVRIKIWSGLLLL